MGETRIDLPQGTLDLLILKTVATGPRHGCAIADRIHREFPAKVHNDGGRAYFFGK